MCVRVCMCVHVCVVWVFLPELIHDNLMYCIRIIMAKLDYIKFVIFSIGKSFLAHVATFVNVFFSARPIIL